MQDVFFSMENHKEGAWFRFYTDETDKFSSTFLTIDFDLSLTVLEEPIIVSNNMHETSVALINEFTERNRLTPKYIGSFLDHWNSYKKENNKFHGISPLETGTLPIDVDHLLQKIKNESETTNFQSIEQIDLPIGKINSESTVFNKKSKQEQAKPDTLPVFTEKQMNYARRVNMYDYMLARGEEFIKVSSKFVSHAYHDSLCANVNTGVVTWYSQNINSFNNGIEFSMSFFNEPFEEATQNILDFYSDQQSIRKEKQQIRQQIPATPFSLSKLTEGGNYAKDFLDEKGMNYLLSRYISKETIQHFQERRLITSDNRSNILFSMSGLTKGELGTVVGADVQGTYPKPVKDRIRFDKVSGEMKLDRKYFKGIALNTQQDHGFLYGTNVQFNQPFHLFVVEGPIESLSYYELFKNQLPDNSWILSTSGLKAETIVKTNEQLKTLLKTENSTIVLAVNNDDPGKNFVRKFYDIYQENPALKETSKLKLQLPTIEDGDFNEVLELKKTGQLASRVIKENEYAQAKKFIQKRTKEANELVGVYQ